MPAAPRVALPPEAPREAALVRRVTRWQVERVVAQVESASRAMLVLRYCAQRICVERDSGSAVGRWAGWSLEINHWWAPERGKCI